MWIEERKRGVLGSDREKWRRGLWNLEGSQWWMWSKEPLNHRHAIVVVAGSSPSLLLLSPLFGASNMMKDSQHKIWACRSMQATREKITQQLRYAHVEVKYVERNGMASVEPTDRLF